jgi:hypothetical protein
MFIHGRVGRGSSELWNGVSHRTHSLPWRAYDFIIFALPEALRL